jgi:AcrR family transcriptional regulator
MGKGEQTRTAILGRALELSRTVGLEGVTIGGLAEALNLSKSGLFAHFQSKEKLQLEILEYAAAQVTELVFVPALKKPRGIPRIHALFDHWLVWGGKPGGCPFIHAAVEFDDQPGPVRDQLLATQKQLIDALRKSAQIAKDDGQFQKNVDTEQFAYEFHGILLAYHYNARLLRDRHAELRARKALDALIDRARA